MSDAILDKVRKLLAKAEDQACLPAEAEAFNAKAAELIAKYGVDRALLAEADPASDIVGDRVIDLPAPYALDKCGLLANVASALRCHSVRRERWIDGRRVFSMHLFGFASDIDRVELLFTSLLVQASHSLSVQTVPAHESVAAYRRSWLLGFAHAVAQRLRAAEALAAETPTDPGVRSVALVLADRTAVVAKRVTDAYPQAKFGGGSRRLGGSGRREGYTAGQRADLGGTRLTNSTRRAVG